MERAVGASRSMQAGERHTASPFAGFVPSACTERPRGASVAPAMYSPIGTGVRACALGALLVAGALGAEPDVEDVTKMAAYSARRRVPRARAKFEKL